MTGHRTSRRSLAAILITFGLAGCLAIPAATPADPPAKVAETPPAEQPTTGDKFLDEYRQITRNPPARETWRCCDYARGCGRSSTAITLTVNDPKPLNDLFERIIEHPTVNPSDLDISLLDIVFFDDQGTVTLAGTDSQKTEFRIEGLDRRWNWGAGLLKDKPKETFRYAFTIEPAGIGRYFDFNFVDEDDKATSRQHYQCEKR